MGDQFSHQTTEERLEAAYNAMMQRVRQAMDQAGEKAQPIVEAIDKAAENAVELGELTREESVKVAEYLRRDLHQAADYLNNTSDEFSTWLRFDWQLIEERLRDTLYSVVKRSAEEVQTWSALREAADSGEYIWRTGEITAPGTLACQSCNKTMTFHKTSRIPPCSSCHATTFQRVD